MTLKITQLMPPYRAGLDPTPTHAAYVDQSDGRFCAAQPFKGGSWAVYHRRSGNRVDSLFGRVSLTRDDAIRGMEALNHAEHIDWSYFDEIEFGQSWVRTPPREQIDHMRAIAKAALS